MALEAVCTTPRGTIYMDQCMSGAPWSLQLLLIVLTHRAVGRIFFFFYQGGMQLFKIEVLLIYNICFRCITVIQYFYKLYSIKLSQDNGYNSLCCTIYPYCLPILYIVVCINLFLNSLLNPLPLSFPSPLPSPHW